MGVLRGMPLQDTRKLLQLLAGTEINIPMLKQVQR